MTLRYYRIALAVLSGFLLLLSGCGPKNVKQFGPAYVNLSYNGGNCTQNGGTGVVDLYQNQAVVYQGANTLSQFQVQFTTCPFSSCPVTSGNGAPVNIGQPNQGTIGNTYNYSSVTINNQQCNGVGSMGVRIRGGP